MRESRRGRPCASFRLAFALTSAAVLCPLLFLLAQLFRGGLASEVAAPLRSAMAAQHSLRRGVLPSRSQWPRPPRAEVEAQSPNSPVVHLVATAPRAMPLLLTHGASYDAAAVIASIGVPAAHLVGKDGKAPLLVIYGSQDAWKDYVSEEFFHLFRLLQHAHGWVIVQQTPAPTWEAFGDAVAISLGGRTPDVLLLMEEYSTLAPLNGSRASSRLARTHIILYGNDLHTFTDAASVEKLAAIRVADTFAGSYTYNLGVMYPQLASKRTLWLPHAASAVFLLPLRPRSAVFIKVFLSGATSALWYPYRAQAEARVMANDTRIVQHVHPGYGPFPSNAVGAGFAALINQHLACLTDGLILNYSVGKIFELPAAGCLLLLNAEMAPVMEQLGFQPMVHYVPYIAETMDVVIDAVLAPENSAAVDMMRQQGQALVWARHTSSNRAAALHAHAVRMISGG